MLGMPKDQPFPTTALDARPVELQSHSPLLLLPPEIRNEIYRLLVLPDGPIIDPSHRRQKSPHCRVPLRPQDFLLTCRQAYAEFDYHALLSRNRFRFTDAAIAHDFFRRLPETHRLSVTDVELDIRNLGDKRPNVSAAWMQYLFWSDSFWANSFSSLRCDVPALKTLRIAADSWAVIPMKRHQIWEVFRRMLQFVRGLESIVVVGTGRGGWMEQQDPWSTVHYVGTDILGDNDLLDRMILAVGGETECQEKYAVWTRENGKIQLEVTTEERIQQCSRSLPKICLGVDPFERLPKDGYCNVSVYHQRVAARAQSS